MTVFAVPALFDAVVARFALEIPVPADRPTQLFGWREPAHHKTVDKRIVWTPGDPTGALGAIGAPKYPGGNWRSLGTLAELVTVRISAVDRTAPENERSQYIATRLLFDAWFRAVRLAAYGRFNIVSAAWNVSKLERRYGEEIVVVLAVQAAIPDAAQTSVGSIAVPVLGSDTPKIDSNGDGVFTADSPLVLTP